MNPRPRNAIERGEFPKSRRNNEEMESLPSAEGNHCLTLTFCTPLALIAFAVYLTIEWIVKLGRSTNNGNRISSKHLTRQNSNTH